MIQNLIKPDTSSLTNLNKPILSLSITSFSNARIAQNCILCAIDLAMSADESYKIAFQWQGFQVSLLLLTIGICCGAFFQLRQNCDIFIQGEKKDFMIAHKPLIWLVGRPRFERGTIALKDRTLFYNINKNNALHSANMSLWVLKSPEKPCCKYTKTHFTHINRV